MVTPTCHGYGIRRRVSRLLGLPEALPVGALLQRDRRIGGARNGAGTLKVADAEEDVLVAAKGSVLSGCGATIDFAVGEWYRKYDAALAGTWMRYGHMQLQ